MSETVLESYRRRIRLLKATLKFYANHANWEHDGIFSGCLAEEDAGDLARKALGIEESGERSAAPGIQPETKETQNAKDGTQDDEGSGSSGNSPNSGQGRQREESPDEGRREEEVRIKTVYYSGSENWPGW